LEDEANRVVTVRSRDSMEQTSVPLRDLVEHIEEEIGAYAREE
jgi:glycyl-tRNA synthetase (class II)